MQPGLRGIHEVFLEDLKSTNGEDVLGYTLFKILSEDEKETTRILLPRNFPNQPPQRFSSGNNNSVRNTLLARFGANQLQNKESGELTEEEKLKKLEEEKSKKREDKLRQAQNDLVEAQNILNHHALFLPYLYRQYELVADLTSCLLTVWTYLALLEIRSGKYADALTYSQKMIEVDSKHIDGRLLHGFALVGQSDLRLAAENLGQAKRLLSEDTKTKSSLGNKKYRSKSLEIGEARLKRKEDLWYAKSQALGSSLTRNRGQG